jgi:hypothetical protein
MPKLKVNRYVIRKRNAIAKAITLIITHIIDFPAYGHVPI